MSGVGGEEEVVEGGFETLSVMLEKGGERGDVVSYEKASLHCIISQYD